MSCCGRPGHQEPGPECDHRHPRPYPASGRSRGDDFWGALYTHKEINASLRHAPSTRPICARPDGPTPIIATMVMSKACQGLAPFLSFMPKLERTLPPWQQPLWGTYLSCHVSACLVCAQLVMRWFQFTIADFEESINPPNGGLIIVERKQDAQVGTEALGLRGGARRLSYRSGVWRI